MKPGLLLILSAAVLIVIAALVFKKKERYDTTNDSSLISEDEKKARQLEVLTLAGLAKAHATKKWCQSKNMMYDADTQSCSHTKETCEEAQRFVLAQRAKDPNSEDYNYNYEWHPEAQSCVKIIGKIPDICVRISQMFDDENTQVTTFPYIQAEVNCDKYGGCQVLKRPSCQITKKYCDKKGLSSSEDNEGVDCYVSEDQEIAEAIIGSKFVRKYRADGVKGVVGAVGQTFGQYMDRGGVLGIAGDKLGGVIGGDAGNIIRKGSRLLGGGLWYDAGKSGWDKISSLF